MFSTGRISFLFVKCLLFLCLSFLVFVRGEKCKSCELRQQKEDRLVSIRGQILTKLGFTEPPRGRKAMHINDDDLETYREAVRESRMRDGIEHACAGVRRHHRYFAKSIAKLRLVEETAKAVFLFDPTKKSATTAEIFTLKFDASEPDTGSEIERAELRVSVNWFPIGGRITIYVCEDYPNDQLLSNYNTTLEDVCGNMIGSSPLDVTKPTVTFDVTYVMQAWTRTPRSNSKLTLIVRHLKEKIVLSPNPTQGRGQTSKALRPSPHILTSYIPAKRLTKEKRRRRKRALDMRFCQKRLKEKRCCLRSLYVDFHRDLKWKWIHAPPGFHANYCGGECPFLWSYHNQTHHTTVMGLLNSYNPDSPGKPCCVANSYKPLVILYYEQGRPRIEELTNMIVNECNCV